MRRTDSLEKTLMLGKIQGRRRRGRQRMRWLDGITDLMDMSLSKLQDGQGSLACCSPWGSKESDTTERLNYEFLKIIFIYGEICITEFIMLAIFKHIVLSTSTSLRNHHYHLCLELFLSYKIKTLYLLNTNYPFPLPALLVFNGFIES